MNRPLCTRCLEARETIEEMAERIRQLEALAHNTEWEPPVLLGLTGTEGRILAVLMGRQGIVTRARLFDALYGARPEQPEEKIIDVLLVKVRAKLRPHGVAIATSWGQGWMLEAEDRARLLALAEAEA